MHTASLALRATPPFDFAQSLAFLSGFAPAAGDQQIADGRLTRVFSLAGSAVLAELSWNGSVDQPVLSAQLWAEHQLDAALLTLAEDRLRFYLSLDDDLRPFYAQAALDPPFAAVVQRRHGYHQAKFPTPFENAVWAVLTQRTPMPIARRARQNLVASYGPTLRRGDTSFAAFPEPVLLSMEDPAALETVVGNKQKAGYIQELARAFASVDEHWLRGAPYHEVERWLRAIKGMGPWSASFVLVRGLGRMEQVPAGEARLAEAASRVYGRSVSEADLAALAAPYGVYQGYWAHYLRAAG